MWKKCFKKKYKNVIDLESSLYKYPNINNWEEVVKRCIERGNNEAFIIRLKEVFVPYYEDSLKRSYEKMYILNKNETLEDVLIENNIGLVK